MKFFLAIFSLFLGTALQAQLPYTLNLADGTTTVASPHRAGINLDSLNYYDNGQIYKNLVAEDNYAFENTLEQQIWALNKGGNSTTFCNTNQYAIFPLNFFAGATVTVVESNSANKGYTGKVASSTTGSSNTPACYTLSSSAPAAFAAGDQVVVTLNQFPSKESCWETPGNCGIWTNIANGGKLLTDSTTPYDGKQSLIMDVTASASSVAGANLYFDSDAQNHFVLLNGAYEVSGWMKTGAAAVNHVLNVCVGRPGAQQCKSYAPTSEWTKFSSSMSFSETNTTVNSAASVSAYISGANGRGQVEIDNLSLTKTSGQDSTNTSVFRDEFVNAMRQYCATEVTGPTCLIRNWTNQNGETMANWTAPSSAAAMTMASAGALTYGEITPQLLDYLNLVKLVGGTPYLVEPVTFHGSDPANLVEYLSSTNTGSGYGKIRAAQGQSEPWVGTGGVFSDIYVSFCNECWNESSFSGQSLPYRAAATGDYYHDYWNRTKDVYAEMRADSAFNTGIHLGFNMQLGVNYAPGGLDTALRGMAAVGGAADYVEQAPYEQGTLSSWQTDAALWGSALEQPWEDAANPLSKSKYYQAVKAIQSYKLCGETGKAACVATDYEQANGTLTTCGIAGWPACTGGANQAIDQTHEDRINAGAAQGIIAPLQVALNQQQLGVTAQNYFGATEYSNGTLSTSGAKVSKLWGLCVDYGGATSYLNGENYSCRPQFMGLSILNQAIIGPEYSCSVLLGPSYLWLGSTVNGPTSPMVGVPYVYPFCFKGGEDNPNQRSIVLFNTNLNSSYSINFFGTHVPSGTCTQEQFAPSSPDLMNEAATGTPTNTTAAKTKIASSSVACGSSITLPPDSETAITYTIGGETPTATPTFSPAGGTYTAAQSVTIANTTSGAKIYYTLDGSTPTTSSSLYSAAVAVSGSKTLKAVAIATSHTVSAAAAATYTINVPAATAVKAPVFSVAAGTYTAAQTVSITAASGNLIYYTTNNTTPTTSSTRYASAIAVKTSETLRAIAVSGKTASAVTAAAYVIGQPYTAPYLSLHAGTYTSEQTLKIVPTSSSQTVYYTTNGQNPTAASTKYTAPLTIKFTQNLRAIGISGKTMTGVASATYVIAAAAPEPLQAAGTYTEAINIQLVTTTAGAVIHFTLDGTTPTTSSPTFNSYIKVSRTDTLKAVAMKPGLSNSAVTTGVYTIKPFAATPKFSKASGSYKGSQTETITDATPGAVIYYTTDQTTPTTSSKRYTGPFTVSGTEYIQAIAVATNYTTSFIGSANVDITQ